MFRFFNRTLLVFFVLICVSRTNAQEDPAVIPPFVTFQLPFDEKSFHPNPGYPSVRIWPFRTPIAGGLECHTTGRGVGPDSAMLFYLPKGARQGTLMIYDGGALERGNQKDLSTYKGVCFWLRGDGGDGLISLGTELNQIRPEYPRIGKYPFTKKWTKYFVPWDKFTPAIKPPGFFFINIQLEPKTDRACWAVLTRVALYKEEKTEEIDPPAAEDPQGEIPAGNFVSPSVADAQAMLPKTMAKLKAKQPITIAVAGDSITAGAQLWYMNPSNTPRFSDAYIFWAVLEEKLAKYYGYDQHRFVFKMRIYPNKQKDPTGEEHFEIMTGQTPESDGTLPFNGLQVIGVGAGGKDSRFALANLGDATQFKPDLVIWAYGANDAPANHLQIYRECTTKAIESLKAQGIEVILTSPTPWTLRPYYAYSVNIRDESQKLAPALHVPLADQLGAYIARGERYRGDLLSDLIHSNEFGHETMAATLAAALGVPNQMTWDTPYFRALAKGEKIPD